MNMQADIAAAVRPHWERLRPLIQKAVKFSPGMTEEQLLAGVLDRRYGFFPAEKAFVFACIEDIAANMFLAGGDHQEVARLEPEILAWAKVHKVRRIRTEVRLGVEKTDEQHGHFKALGYRRARIVYEKDIPDV